MAQGYKLWKDSSYCVSGKIKKWVGDEGGEAQDIDCPYCAGVGYTFFGWCSGDLFDMPSNFPEPEG